MGKDILSIRTSEHRFENGTLELDDLPRFERALEVDLNVLKQLIEEGRRLINYTAFSRATWVRSSYTRNTPERIRQNEGIW